MRYGFAIDQRTCIGCHACTVACKTEHQVPLQQNRTWVKYVDSGTFPDSRRDFAVLRCNHCTDAPCVRICPTEALFKRDDGIVDFDSAACIGCKSCLQACPYDALYIDAETQTAAKCNFCAHRVDNGLEPACVTVCPTHSIWVGDLDDPDSGIARLVADNDTRVRAPEQHTGPNVHYVGASPLTLDPLAAPVDDTYIWAKPDDLRRTVAGDLVAADATARTTLNTAHPVAWGWRVATYLWTKGLGGGALLTAALAVVVGLQLDGLGDVAAPVLGALGAGTTGVLLVWDLKRPERFYYLFTRPNHSSWLVLGGYCLLLFGAACLAWFGFAVLGSGPPVWLGWVVLVPSVLVAAYTAFLFAQAEGRDLWQSPWLLPHLVLQALMAGAGALGVLAPVVSPSEGGLQLLALLMGVGALGHLVVTPLDLLGKHATANAEVAARVLTRGRLRQRVWASVGMALAVLALAVAGLVAGSPWPVAAGGLLAQVSLLVFEFAYVRAAQEVPLS